MSLVFDLLARDHASRTFRDVGNAAERAGKQGHGFGSSVSSGMRLAAGALAAAGLGSMFAGFIKDAQESAKIAARTANVIATTGGAANITAGQVNALATAISNKTAVDDEAIQSASNLLLTFTKVRNEAGAGNDVFNQATQAAIDMSVAMGTDANSAALQLGKALNDPIKGITALSRAGVSFTEQQKEQIRTLVESGDVLGAQKIILAEMQVQFGGAAAAAANPLERLKVIAGNLGEEVGGFLLPAIEKFAGFLSERLIPGVKGLFDLLVRGDFTAEFGRAFGLAEDSGFVDFLFRVRETAITVFTEVKGAITAFVEAFKAGDGDITSSGLPGFMERVGYAARLTFDYMKDTVIPALVDFGQWIVRNRDWIVPFVAAIGAAVLAFKAFMIVKTVALAVQALWVVLAANPIGLVIAAVAAMVAGLVFAYQRSETFRAIVDAAFRAVGAAASWLWDNILKPVFGFIGAAFQALAAGIGLAWENVIKPAWDAISTVATWLWDNILKPIFGFISAAWNVLGTAIAWVWTNLVKPAWDALSAAAKWLWNNVLSPIFSAISTAWDALGRGLDWVYETLIKPVFDTFMSIVNTVRDSFQTAVDTIKAVWDTLVDALKAPVQVVIDFVWNNGLRKLWNVINNIWGGDDIAPFRLATGGVIPGYTPGRDVHRFVSPTGGMLDLSGGEAVMRPEWTRVLGKPTIDYWNHIARQEGETGLRRVLGRDGLGRQAFAGGGIVSLQDRSLPWWANLLLGPQATAINTYIAREASLTKDQDSSQWGQMLGSMTRDVGNNLWNTIKSKVESWFGAQSVTAAGSKAVNGGAGMGWNAMMSALRAVFPGLALHSGFRPGSITATGNLSYHALGRAVDVPPRMDVFNWIARNFPGSRELIFSPAGGRQIWNGRPHVYSEPTRGDHWDHVHWAMNRGGLLNFHQGGVVPNLGIPDIPALVAPGETIRTVEQEAALRQPITVYAQFGSETIEAKVVRVVAGREQRATRNARSAR